MRVTVVHTTASAADIAGYEALHPIVVVPLTRGVRTPAGPRRQSGRRPALQTALSLGDTSMVTVVRPARHSVGGGPRARPATISG
jgi:hypothetical protein